MAGRRRTREGWLLGLFDHDLGWQAQAACRDEDPDLFFPTAGNVAKTVAQATAICDRCPVLADCGTYADAADEAWGVWGGKLRTPFPRRQTKVPA